MDARTDLNPDRKPLDIDLVESAALLPAFPGPLYSP
jgi:hypothetical protein